MKAKSSTSDNSSIWITLTGIVLAILLCLMATSMVMIVYPGSTSLFSRWFDSAGKLVAAEPSNVFAAPQPTPFQPGPQYTPMPAVASEQNINQTQPAQQVAYVPSAQQAGSSQAEEGVIENSDEIPLSSYVQGLKGTAQLYTLDCESQSAVDWAKFFGVSIDENEFIDRLPRSDDPESGFVGSINGAMGQFPPDDYGVHAAPIAKLLQAYGLPAKAAKNVDFDDIKREITKDYPVIVWIVNMPFEIDTKEYTASNGNTTTVARFEHTWIIIGYNASTVTVVDSKWTYNVNTTEFLNRWEALGKQAVVYDGN